MRNQNSRHLVSFSIQTKNSKTSAVLHSPCRIYFSQYISFEGKTHSKIQPHYSCEKIHQYNVAVLFTLISRALRSQPPSSPLQLRAVLQHAWVSACATWPDSSGKVGLLDGTRSKTCSAFHVSVRRTTIARALKSLEPNIVTTFGVACLNAS